MFANKTQKVNNRPSDRIYYHEKTYDKLFYNMILCRAFRELHRLYSSPSIFRLMKTKRIRWAGYVERMGRSGTQVYISPEDDP
jgi:hypothetical protein